MSIRIIIFTICITLGYATIATYTSGMMKLYLTIAFLIALVVSAIFIERWERRQPGFRKWTVPEKVLIFLWIILFPDVVGMATAKPFLIYPIIGLGTLVFVYLLKWTFDMMGTGNPEEVEQDA